MLKAILYASTLARCAADTCCDLRRHDAISHRLRLDPCHLLGKRSPVEEEFAPVPSNWRSSAVRQVNMAVAVFVPLQLLGA
jgi:hypothetical protein